MPRGSSSIDESGTVSEVDVDAALARAADMDNAENTRNLADSDYMDYTKDKEEVVERKDEQVVFTEREKIGIAEVHGVKRAYLDEM